MPAAPAAVPAAPPRPAVSSALRAAVRTAPAESRPAAAAVVAPPARVLVSEESDFEVARRLLNRGEFDAALEILDRAYRAQPGDESLRRLLAEAEAAFIEKAYRHYLPPAKVVVLTRATASLSGERLSPTEFFLLSRLDSGSWDVRSIIQITPLREVDVLRALKKMRETGVIELRDPTPPPHA